MNRNHTVELRKIVHQTLNHVEVQLVNVLQPQHTPSMKKNKLMKKFAESKVLISRLLVTYRWWKRNQNNDVPIDDNYDYSKIFDILKYINQSSEIAFNGNKNNLVNIKTQKKDKIKQSIFNKLCVIDLFSKGIPKEITNIYFSKKKIYIYVDNVYTITLKCCNDGNDLKTDFLKINWPKKVGLDVKYLKQVVLMINKFLKDKNEDSLFKINKLLHRIYKIGLLIKHISNLKLYTKAFSFSILKIENGIILKFPFLYGVTNTFYFTLKDGVIAIRTDEPMYSIPENDETIFEIKRTDTFDAFFLIKFKPVNFSQSFSDKMDYQQILSSIRDYGYYTSIIKIWISLNVSVRRSSFLLRNSKLVFRKANITFGRIEIKLFKDIVLLIKINVKTGKSQIQYNINNSNTIIFDVNFSEYIISSTLKQFSILYMKSFNALKHELNVSLAFLNPYQRFFSFAPDFSISLFFSGNFKPQIQFNDVNGNAIFEHECHSFNSTNSWKIIYKFPNFIAYIKSFFFQLQLQKELNKFGIISFLTKGILNVLIPSCKLCNVKLIDNYWEIKFILKGQMKKYYIIGTEIYARLAISIAKYLYLLNLWIDFRHELKNLDNSSIIHSYIILDENNVQLQLKDSNCTKIIVSFGDINSPRFKINYTAPNSFHSLYNYGLESGRFYSVGLMFFLQTTLYPLLIIEKAFSSINTHMKGNFQYMVSNSYDTFHILYSIQKENKKHYFSFQVNYRSTQLICDDNVFNIKHQVLQQFTPIEVSQNSPSSILFLSYMYIKEKIDEPKYKSQIEYLYLVRNTFYMFSKFYVELISLNYVLKEYFQRRNNSIITFEHINPNGIILNVKIESLNISFVLSSKENDFLTINNFINNLFINDSNQPLILFENITLYRLFLRFLTICYQSHNTYQRLFHLVLLIFIKLKEKVYYDSFINTVLNSLNSFNISSQQPIITIISNDIKYEIKLLENEIFINDETVIDIDDTISKICI